MKTDNTFKTDVSSAVAGREPATETKEIVVAIDFSESSIKALRHAAEMAAKEHAHLTLLNVVNEPASFRTLDQPRQEQRERHDHKLRLQQLVRQELGAGVHPRLMVCTGDAAAEIKRVAAEEHAGLIILSRHPHHGLGRWFHPDTASKVISHAPCPVMVLNEEPPEPTGRHLAA